ncbi:MAG: hypothetical protein NWE89_16635 [Candidatus Bathyarchaeota archaeon]|nr:hypothetical protein [Candidatus Bathyarchaeota archaeon]
MTESRQESKVRREQFTYIAVSLTGLIVLGLLSFIETSTVRIPYQSQIIGGIFTGICILGVIAAVSPGAIRGTNHSGEPGSGYLGHHPVCGVFDTHVLRVGNRVLCAGCTGLAVGAIVAIFGMILYFIGGISFGAPARLFLVGAFLVSLGLVQHFIDMGNPVVHSLLNVFFVSGSFLSLLALDALRTSLLVDVYFLGLVLFWIMTRIRVSQGDHVIICRDCDRKCGEGYL